LPNGNGTPNWRSHARMTENRSSLPDYSNPPVIEVALGVQFQSIPGFGTPHIGLLWEMFRAEFPVTQEQPPLAHTVEEFGLRVAPRISLEALPGPPVPRVWFLNRAGSELVQVQPDRLVVNWRKTADDQEYPHYVDVRAKFDRALDAFRQFLATEDLPDIQPDQCEVTYVNHCLAGAGWERHGEAHRVVAVWRDVSDSFLPEPEEVRFAVSYLVAEGRRALGRLHVNFEPAYRSSDNQPLVVMRLVARGAPIGEGVAGVGGFLDAGHTWIVQGFTSLTTPEMHAVWGRIQ
jgi:uncharacterized protein (TIGR04255 family)